MMNRTKLPPLAAALGFGLLLALFIVSAPACKPRGDTTGEVRKAEEGWKAPESRPEGPVQVVEVPPFVKLAKELKPAVVNISTSRKVEGLKFPHLQPPFSGPGEPEDDDTFKEFFDRFLGNIPRPMRKQTSLGSGFIIDGSGLVVTNHHVIEKADDIQVTTADGRTYDAEIKGVDPKTDVALIKIDPEGDLPTVQLGDSGKLQIGEWVMAIGNPFGLGHTVTAGIVSAKERVLNSGPYDDFIQTDASINPGNSGGPLFNIRGEVVGINTAIVAHGRGIGFAIPINLARSILVQLEKAGKVTRGWLGVSIQKIDPLLAESFGLEESKGALVAEVMKESPASRAGIKRGDVIIEFKGESVETFHDLPAMVAAIQPGEKVSLKILREGKEIDIEVTVDELKDEREAKAEPAPKADIVGLKVKPVPPEQAERLGLEEDAGVMVSGVGPGSAAGEAGIQKGDIILEINRKPLAGIDDYREVMKAIEDDESVLMLVRRDESSFYVALNLG
jgi:serine protease Do